MGSSPRVRGSQCPLERELEHRGIIPAGAGLTFWVGLDCVEEGDHPRGCGAHAQQGRQHHHRAGSSPRVRGSLRDYHGQCEDLGIIPAGAGLTASD